MVNLRTNDFSNYLTHWGWVTHICVGKLIIIGSNNGLSPDRCQAIIWTNAGLLSIGPLRTYFSENLFKIQQFSLRILHVKMSSAKWRPSCLGINVLNKQRQKNPKVTWVRRRGQVTCQVTGFRIGDRKRYWYWNTTVTFYMLQQLAYGLSLGSLSFRTEIESIR